MKSLGPFVFAITLLTAVAARGDVLVYGIESIQIEDLGTFGGDEAVANDVNNYGAVVGWARMSLGIPHAFLHENSQIHDISGSLGLYPAYANGINNNGEVVGYYSVPGSFGDESRPFYWNFSGLTTLDSTEQVPPVHSVAMAINDNGNIAGYASTGGNCRTGDRYYAAYWQTPSSWRQLIRCPTGNSQVAQAFDINNSGTVVGLEGSPQGDGWTWAGGATALIPGPSGAASVDGVGINETGALVGAVYGGGRYAFFWNGSSANGKSLGALPGGDDSGAKEVNDQAFVAGYSKAAIFSSGFNYAWRERGFIWHAHFGMKMLPILPGTTASTVNCRAHALSNRSPFTQNIYAVGYCTNNAGKKRAVRWTLKVPQQPVGIAPPVLP
jgi:probable HAF family extracellular repeat protein